MKKILLFSFFMLAFASFATVTSKDAIHSKRNCLTYEIGGQDTQLPPPPPRP
jgi:hypothetical protein